jgi:hypothetical protein
LNTSYQDLHPGGGTGTKDLGAPNNTWRNLYSTGAIISGPSVASTPTSIVSGSVFSGGTPLTALPKSLIQPAVNLYTGVTGVASPTNIITVVGHAFANGDTVAFSSLTGGSGLFTNSKYFVVNVSGNTFQLSLTSGGGAITFTSDITAGTITNYAVWSTSGTMLGVNAGPTFTGDLLNLQTGGVSGFRVNSLGGLSANGITTLSNAISISGRGSLRANSDGNFDLINNSNTAANLTLQNISASGTTIVTGASAASTPASLLSGAVFTGGTGTTNFPHFLIQPTAATAATSWSTAGTVIGVNTASGFSGNLIDLKVNGAGTSAFKVSSGGSTTLGNITTVGPITSGGALITTPATQSGAGALSVSVSSIALTTTGVANALTLANGTAGQLLTISHVSRGGGTGTAVLTPTTTNGYTTITFTATGDSVMLQYHTTGGWHIVGSRGVTIA